jgi:DGQHR domain-containing protein
VTDQPRELRVPAFKVQQSERGELFSFVVDGKRIPEFAAVSRIGRDGGEDVVGYQRPEVARHIGEIRTYLETEGAIIPNAIVVSFDDSVRFEADGSETDVEGVAMGWLIIPINDDGEKPGWIVDGQQRVAALREARLNGRGFPICVVAFVAADERVQREQFILVNSTKPLPRGLIYELLPHTDTRLATHLELRRFPATLVERLNHDPESPFHRRIKTPTNPGGLIKDNSVLKMLENSLYEGALYEFRDPATGRGDIETMVQLLNNFWTAVANCFADAWDSTPRKSRLVHGAGIVGLGHLMDAIADRHSATTTVPSVRVFQEDLVPLTDACAWTGGTWQFSNGDDRGWNELQNTPRDIQRLANHLLRAYRDRVWRREFESTPT